MTLLFKMISIENSREMRQTVWVGKRDDKILMLSFLSESKPLKHKVINRIGFE
jgi:hypothetical protein